MVFFKKKISVNDFCNSKCDFIFSGNGKKFMDDFMHNCGDDKLSNMDSKEKYYKHFEAVYLQLIGITMSKDCSIEVAMSWYVISSDYLRSKGYDDIYTLCRMYNSVFGSSYYVDGIKEIVLTFFEELTGSKPNDKCFKIYYDGFYSILSSLFKETRKVKLIP